LRDTLVPAISAMLIVVIDPDRPRWGLIRVSKDRMVWLQSNTGEFPRDVSAP
jgi:hypothetical protein